jgi:hypothetical protein
LISPVIMAHYCCSIEKEKNRKIFALSERGDYKKGLREVKKRITSPRSYSQPDNSYLLHFSSTAN